MADNAYTPSEQTQEMYKHYTLVSRVKNASYGNNVFKTDPQFAGLSLADCVMKVLDNEPLRDQFLAENEEYKENNTLATFLFGQFRKTGRTPREVANLDPKVRKLYDNKVEDFKSKFGI